MKCPIKKFKITEEGNWAFHLPVKIKNEIKMKNVLVIFMALATFGMNAQDRNKDLRSHHKAEKRNMTLEQQAELRSKKMTLSLGLNTSQQEKVEQLYLEMSNNRPEKSKSRNEMTDTQKYEAKNTKMDQKIAFKRQMKEILTEEQMAKWEDLKSEKSGRKGARSHKTRHRKNQKNKLQD